MARSTYIYVASLGGNMLGAFTVRHELVSKLQRIVASNARRADDVLVFRARDAGEASEIVFYGTAGSVINGRA